jgi:hypothetical protein
LVALADVASGHLEKPNSLSCCIRHVQGSCTNDASAGILITQEEERQSFKVEMIGGFAQLGNRDRQAFDGDEASSHIPIFISGKLLELYRAARVQDVWNRDHRALFSKITLLFLVTTLSMMTFWDFS